jgi:hypothetical protein
MFPKRHAVQLRWLHPCVVRRRARVQFPDKSYELDEHPGQGGGSLRSILSTRWLGWGLRATTTTRVVETSGSPFGGYPSAKGVVVVATPGVRWVDPRRWNLFSSKFCQDRFWKRVFLPIRYRNLIWSFPNLCQDRFWRILLGSLLQVWSARSPSFAEIDFGEFSLIRYCRFDLVVFRVLPGSILKNFCLIRYCRSFFKLLLGSILKNLIDSLLQVRFWIFLGRLLG